MPKRKKITDPNEDEDKRPTDSGGKQARVRHTEMLNDSFFRWIKDQHLNHRSESWRNGMEEYLEYSKDIQTKYPIAVDAQAAGTGTNAAVPGSFSTKNDGAAGSIKPTFGFDNSKSQQTFSGATTSTPPACWPATGFGATATTKSPPSFTAGNSKATAAAVSKHQTPLNSGFGTAGNMLPASTGKPASADGVASGLATASTTSVPFPTFVSPALSTSANPAFPFSTPPPAAALTASALTSAAATNQLPAKSSAQVSTSAIGFPAPSGAGMNSPLGTAAPNTSKPFAFGASQPTSPADTLSFSLGANSAAPSFGTSGPAPSFGASGATPFFGASAAAPSFGSPLPLASTGQQPDAVSAALPDNSTAAAASTTQSTPPVASSPLPITFASGSATTFGTPQPTFGASQPASGSATTFGTPRSTFGASQPAFGAGQNAFGLGKNVFGSSQPASSSSSQPASGSGFAFGASQAGLPSPFPFSFGQASSQPSVFGSNASAAASSPGTFQWGPPSSTAGAAETGSSGSLAAANGNAFSFNSSGQNGFGGAASAPQRNGNEAEEEQAEPEEAVVFEKTEGVLLRQDITWRHCIDDKWSKTRKGKVLVHHPQGDSRPHLQLQTSSGQVVSIARINTPLVQKGKPNQLMGMLAVTVRNVDATGNETFDDQKVWPTLITCGSADAAKELSDKAPAPNKS